MGENYARSKPDLIIGMSLALRATMWTSWVIAYDEQSLTNTPGSKTIVLSAIEGRKPIVRTFAIKKSRLSALYEVVPGQRASSALRASCILSKQHKGAASHPLHARGGVPKTSLPMFLEQRDASAATINRATIKRENSRPMMVCAAYQRRMD